MKLWIYTIIVWTAVLATSLYFFFDSKLDNLNNMVEVHAQGGFVNGCMSQGGQRYRCLDLSHRYMEEIFGGSR